MEDVIIFLLYCSYIYLDKTGRTVRVVFFNLTSAFNTIRPALLERKLTAVKVDAPLESWTVDYLTGRPQYIRPQGCMFDTVMSNTGAPQGTVLSVHPLHLVLHIHLYILPPAEVPQ